MIAPVGQRPGRRGVRPDRRRRRLRHRAGRRPGRHGQLPPRPGAGRRLHADGLADDRRRHQLAQPDVAARRPAARRRPGQRQRDARRARALPAGDQLRHRRRTRQVFQLHPERVEVRGRPHREARAAAGGPALRPQLERPGAGHGLQPRAAPAGARAAGRARRLVQDPAPKVVPAGYELVARLRPRGYPRPEGRDAAPRLARARVPAVHGAGPDARPAARVPVVLVAGPGVAQPDRRHAGRERPGARTRSAPCRLATIVGDPDHPGGRGRREGRGVDHRRAPGRGPRRLHGRADQVTTLRITDRANGSRQREPARSRTSRSP